VWALVSSAHVSQAAAQSSGGASSQPAGADPVLARWLARAETLHERGRDRPAILVLRRAVARAPTDPRPVLALGAITLPSDPGAPAAVEPPPRIRTLAQEIHDHLGDVVVDGDPTDPRYREISAKVRGLGPWTIALTGDHRSAIEGAALAAGRMDRVAAEILQGLGALAIRRHDLIAADEALVAAGRADPTDVELLTDLAAVRLARGKGDDAVRLLLDANRRRPDDLAIQRDLAGAFLAAGRASDGVALFAAIAGEHPEDVRARLDLARAALEAGDAARAAREARAAVDRAPSRDPEPLLVLAAAMIAAGDYEAAREAFRAALRRDPDDVRATRGLASLDSNSR
jgi:Flp pilus assembly protein TadD